MVDCPKCSKRLLPHGQGKDTSLLCNACGIHYDSSLKEKSNDRAFHTGWSVLKQGESMITLTMPAKAWAIIEDTLGMDVNSKMIDESIREELAWAMGQIQTGPVEPTPPPNRHPESSMDSFSADEDLWE
jgi:DNA-directed RNA polymerase subunit M/transcription elongation factor TFIIS